ncbi:DUF2971 domain-containing protein [Pseudomonas plecoglossicida]|uniref:DUF2971 domain-containing protein n=1 Tax=Pseudomonas plecoglossicida TaxID=70775 RepID=UPI0015E2FE8A|nr:DUF2971 domain-containing protein [Pseudomonas plecoglossicida]MBA1321226.1 DUF2971 domain-containing protein [Pseudomonas plecoglossicida]
MSLFHYTDANAVKSILEFQKMWLTDVRFLNDSQEFHDGARFIEAAVKKVASQQEIGTFEHKACAYLEDMGSSFFLETLHLEPRFVCSFSTEEDLLSQWRSYGDYAIEFDRGELRKCLNLVDCIYSDQLKEESMEGAVERALAMLGGGIKAHAVPERSAVDEIKQKLLAFCDVFKSQHFVEESEVRSYESASSYSENILYRAKGSLLIPYLSKDIPLMCVKAIHIGPVANQDLAAVAMQMFLQKICIQNRGMGEIKIEVVKSGIPYRTL